MTTRNILLPDWHRDLYNAQCNAYRYIERDTIGQIAQADYRKHYFAWWRFWNV